MRASGSARSIACPGSLTLPAVRVRSRHTEQAADYGTAAHGWKESGVIPPGKHGALITRKLEQNPIDRDGWWPTVGEHEVTYALNLTSGYAERYRGPRDNSDAWKKAHTSCWLTGTLDYLAVNRRAIWVSDLKTGQDNDPDSKQLMSYLLLAWASLGRHTTYEFCTSIDHWPRYPVNSAITRYFNQRSITAATLQEHEECLRWSVMHPEEFNAGDHCRWCDGQPVCPLTAS